MNPSDTSVRPSDGPNSLNGTVPLPADAGQPEMIRVSLPCLACPQRFDDEKARGRHRMKEHPSHYGVGKCILCKDEYFPDKFAFNTHFEQAHPREFNRLLANVAQRGFVTNDVQIWVVERAFIQSNEDMMQLIIAANEATMNTMGNWREPVENAMEECDDIKPNVDGINIDQLPDATIKSETLSELEEAEDQPAEEEPFPFASLSPLRQSLEPQDDETLSRKRGNSVFDGPSNVKKQRHESASNSGHGESDEHRSQASSLNVPGQTMKSSFEPRVEYNVFVPEEKNKRKRGLPHKRSINPNAHSSIFEAEGGDKMEAVVEVPSTSRGLVPTPPPHPCSIPQHASSPCSSFALTTSVAATAGHSAVPAATSNCAAVKADILLDAPADAIRLHPFWELTKAITRDQSTAERRWSQKAFFALREGSAAYLIDMFKKAAEIAAARDGDARPKVTAACIQEAVAACRLDEERSTSRGLAPLHFPLPYCIPEDLVPPIIRKTTSAAATTTVAAALEAVTTHAAAVNIVPANSFACAQAATAAVTAETTGAAEAAPVAAVLDASAQPAVVPAVPVAAAPSSPVDSLVGATVAAVTAAAVAAPASAVASAESTAAAAPSAAPRARPPSSLLLLRRFLHKSE